MVGKLLPLTICFLLAFAPLPSRAQAQQPPAAAGDQTAESLANRGLIAYAAGKYAEAEAALGQFVAGFGKSAQVTEVMPRVLPPLALSRVRLGKYEAALEAIRLFLADWAKGVQPAVVEDLRFWKAICEAQTGDEETARATLTAFIKDYPRSERRVEAILLIGSLFVKEEKWKEAVNYFVGVEPQLDPAAHGRAVVLELYAREQLNDDDNALRLVVEEYPKSGEIVQIAAFHTLTLELGNVFLDRGEYRKAIAAFQRVWSRDQIKKRQEERLAILQANLERLIATKAPVHLLYQYRQMIEQIGKELATVEKVKQFDSALRFRLAGCFLGMERYREAALIMEGMIEDLPPDDIVEKASVNLVQCWTQIERWPKVVSSAEAFQEKFPKSKQMPLVLIMKGQALQTDRRYPEAVALFDEMLTQYPDSEWAPRALFMKGFCLAVLEDFPAAISTLSSFGQRFPKDALAEDALYWTGMAQFLAKDYAQARPVFEAYLKAYKGGPLAVDAEFRRAFCLHSQKQYEAAIPEWRAFLEAHPKSEYQGEALALLGDALMATGEIDAGIAAFQQISPADKRFFEEGWFKIGKALRIEAKEPELREHMERFVREQSQSSRVPEALYWIGWTYRSEGHPEKAADIYWDAIRKYGNDPKLRAVDDLFPGLARLSPGEQGRAVLRAKLRDLREEADDAKHPILGLRATWAEAALMGKSDPAAMREMLLKALPRVNAQDDNPLIVADFADACRESGKDADATALYRDLLKWNPRAPQKDRAFAGLGLLAKASGHEKAALDYFARFEQETAGSSLFSEVMLAKAELLAARGQEPEAKAALESLLARRGVRGSDKARALFQIGEMHMQAHQPQLAVPYYQRIYVMYGRWTEFVAKAYLRSGEAFEQMQDRAAAVRSYEELTERKDLESFAEAATAKTRLTKLRGEP